MRDIFIQTNLGYKMVCKDVTHVANFFLNLMLVGRLANSMEENGRSKKFLLTIGSGRKHITLYKLEVDGYCD